MALPPAMRNRMSVWFVPPSVTCGAPFAGSDDPHPGTSDAVGGRPPHLHGRDAAAWVRQAERDQGRRPGSTTEERERIKALERENRELRQANEILRKASAYFAQAELDRRSKR